jgi:two-component system, sensor histidine kinase PdtaS
MQRTLIETQQNWVASRFGRLSTGVKMLLILTLGLFPFGLIAILASIENAQESREGYAARIRERAVLQAQRVDSAVSRSVLLLRAASAAIPADASSDECTAALERLTRAEALPGRYALAAGNRWRCASRDFQPTVIRPARGERTAVEISPDGRSLRLALYDAAGAPEGVGEFDRASIAAMVSIPGPETSQDLALRGAGRVMMLQDNFKPGAMDEILAFRQPIAGDRIALTVETGQNPLTAAEWIIILLPVIMWMAAAAVGWLIVDRLLLKPLGRMQRAVAAYQPGDRSLDLPTLSSPAREIGDLGEAFRQVTQTVARHESELEAGLERQIKLVREVHHRVKNNLQVVASLLNLHARGAKNDDAAAAYASIQRRVDALAVVHRNHYAELEDNKGVSLKPLISELGAQLRANAPASAARMQIRLAVEPYYVTQDVAVAIAFLITEIVEYAMFCGSSLVSISLGDKDGGGALLAVESEALKGEAECDPGLTERFDRIVTGLSRQLRSSIDRDADTGRYALEIAVVHKGDR